MYGYVCVFSLVQVVEGVRDLDDNFHSSLHGQLLNGGISLLAERLRVIFKGQPRDLPLLQRQDRSHSGASSQEKLSAVQDKLTLKSRGNTLAGWPLMTKRRELSFLRLASRSSKHCRRNLRRRRRSGVSKEEEKEELVRNRRRRRLY